MKCYQIIEKYYRQIWDKKVGDVKKLIPRLGNKTNYVFHYKDFSCICLQG